MSDAAAHPEMCADDPSEPHVDADGACICLGPCCCDTDGECICPTCCGATAGCNDHADVSRAVTPGREGRAEALTTSAPEVSTQHDPGQVAAVLEAYATMEAKKHQRVDGGCSCGFCVWSIEHVVIMSIRDGWRLAERDLRLARNPVVRQLVADDRAGKVPYTEGTDG